MSLSFPSISTIRPSYYNEEAKEYPGVKGVYQDGGADYLSLADNPIRRWTINYSSPGGLTSTEAATLITLASSALYNPQEGSMVPMDFTPDGESLLSNCFFDEGGFVIKRGAARKIYQIECKLIHRP